VRIRERCLLKHCGRVGVLLLALFGVRCLPVLAQEARERDWEPRRTWVFVVGTLEWKHEEMWNSFPKKNRRDRELVEFFKLQGVPEAQVVYLRDREATERRIESALVNHLSRARVGDLLFLYYTGHGYQEEESGDTYLASYDAGDEGVLGWKVGSIPVAIERYFRGDRAIVVLDNCYSGALTRAVRGQPASRVSYAAMTSSTSDQVSTANWTFTEILLAALEGKAYVDTNGDGRITLGELTAEARKDMAFAEDQRATFAATGSFGEATVLARAEQSADYRIGSRVVVRSEGDWYKGRIIDVDQDRSLFLIHYYGYDDSFNEWVRARQIRWPDAQRKQRTVEHSSNARPNQRGNQLWSPAAATLRMARMASGTSVVMW
jgi:hypothetical protein